MVGSVGTLVFSQPFQGCSCSPPIIHQLLEDGKGPPPEGGLWGSNESFPVPLWPDPGDGTLANEAKAVPRERVGRWGDDR